MFLLTWYMCIWLHKNLLWFLLICYVFFFASLPTLLLAHLACYSLSTLPAFAISGALTHCLSPRPQHNRHSSSTSTLRPFCFWPFYSCCSLIVAATFCAVCELFSRAMTTHSVVIIVTVVVVNVVVATVVALKSLTMPHENILRLWNILKHCRLRRRPSLSHFAIVQRPVLFVMCEREWERGKQERGAEVWESRRRGGACAFMACHINYMDACIKSQQQKNCERQMRRNLFMLCLPFLSFSHLLPFSFFFHLLQICKPLNVVCLLN